MNFLKETLESLKANGKEWNDVKWVGEGKARMSKRKFLKDANFDYDNGYGTAEISTALVIVGNNWWLERDEYDGKEWWEFKQLPQKPTLVNEKIIENMYKSNLHWKYANDTTKKTNKCV